jgi:transposase-like protein
VVRIFPNREAVKRLVTALAMEQSEEWVSGRCYLDMEPFWDERQRPNEPAPIAYAAN